MESQGVDEARRTVVETFCGITAATGEEALFFLESHNWHLDSAIHSFYEADETADGGHGALAEGAEDVAPADAPTASIPLPDPSLPAYSVRSAAGMSSGRDKKPSGSGRPGIRTLADLNRRSSPGSGSGSDSDSDGPQEYYTGGEKSGMLVQDPSKGNRDVDAIFDQARQMGAMEGPMEHHHSSSSSRSFTGTGRLLSGETVPSAPQQPGNVIHNICFWSNGFTINDGPLRRFDDPDNASFLESIRKSECPKELEPADRRSTVHVNLTRNEENCPEPVRRHNPFQGVGRTLGSGSSTGSVVPEPTVTAAAAAPSTVPPPSPGLSVDASLPSTSIQLRLADGTRLVARFNTHHTVGDIRAFIDASRPGAARTYRLQTVDFPPKQLTDLTTTIGQAGLANSVLIQKL